MKKITTTLALLAATSIAAADPKPAPTDSKLAQLVGRWEGTSVFTLQGQTNTWKFALACERAAIGPGISCTVVGVHGASRYEEAHLLGYDKASDTYHLFSVNSWGEAYDHAAKWTDAKKVAFEHRGTRDGKVLRELYSYEFSGNDLTMYAKISTNDVAFGEGTTKLKRVP